jgi:hypothetical protein
MISLLPRTRSIPARDDFDQECYHAPLYLYLRMHQVHQNAGPLLDLLLASSLGKLITIRLVFSLHNPPDDRRGVLGIKRTVSLSIHRKGQVQFTSKSVYLRLPRTAARIDHQTISVYMKNFVGALCRALGSLRVFPSPVLLTMLLVHQRLQMAMKRLWTLAGSLSSLLPTSHYRRLSRQSHAMSQELSHSHLKRLVIS